VATPSTRDLGIVYCRPVFYLPSINSLDTVPLFVTPRKTTYAYDFSVFCFPFISRRFHFCSMFLSRVFIRFSCLSHIPLDEREVLRLSFAHSSHIYDTISHCTLSQDSNGHSLWLALLYLLKPRPSGVLSSDASAPALRPVAWASKTPDTCESTIDSITTFSYS